jgi:hypothetical protein
MFVNIPYMEHMGYNMGYQWDIFRIFWTINGIDMGKFYI